ncbi:hypothetical protein L6164_019656 [Bauhinia variegata]|uniref:Uncharacterized protein n=1 Tax=Bauhinia variegata TaxID=167791 RepID=A0ACB9MSF4_BAUVA|nr:hypothetical protein L6164_019656 [Bauhinia variegata]
MELNSFASKSMSSSEIVRVGRTCSAPLSSFRHKFSVKFSTQFKCRRGNTKIRFISHSFNSLSIVAY